MDYFPWQAGVLVSTIKENKMLPTKAAEIGEGKKMNFPVCEIVKCTWQWQSFVFVLQTSEFPPLQPKCPSLVAKSWWSWKRLLPCTPFLSPRLRLCNFQAWCFRELWGQREQAPVLKQKKVSKKFISVMDSPTTPMWSLSHPMLRSLILWPSTSTDPDSGS